MKVRVALAASLLLNAFVIGAIGGVFLTGSGLHLLGWQRTGPGERPIRTAGAQLPATDRARFEAVIAEVLTNGRIYVRTARQSRRQAAAFFVAPAFDPGRVADLLAAARNAETELQSRLDAAAIAFAATLPPDERATLAAGLARGGPLRHPRSR